MLLFDYLLLNQKIFIYTSTIFILEEMQFLIQYKDRFKITNLH